ncbi:MAG: response regulator [Verrucomicrobia bacterium]|nr:response regulator [Verrucomicrobiota bacterium]MDA1067632.1 response regulator [Verrucomicrobiota bacterium]
MEVTQADTKTRTVLIIEDSDADRLKYREFIGQPTAFNKRFLEEESGNAGLKRYAEESIDCILLDLHLPDMNGVEFLGLFKKQYGDNTCPIIMLTRQGSEADAVMALKSGAHDYLSKNGLTPEALNRSVENAIEKVNLHKRLKQNNSDLENKNLQLQLMKDQLEKLVEDRTKNLIESNERLLVEIEERRKAESQVRESARFNRMIMDAAPAFIAYIDENDCYRFANEHYQKIFQCSEEDLLGISMQNHLGNAFENYRKAVLSGDPQDFEHHRTYEQGLSEWFHILLTPHTGAFGEMLGYFIVGMDITRQKENEDFIQRSLDEKQILLREVHHRVKNNLQVIQSLLRMQGRESQSAALEPLLRESQNRIRSIALIHEQLYKQEDVSEIDFADYLKLLLQQVFRTFEFGSKRISSQVDFKNIYLSLTKAIPCALIINELVTNSIKYAFQDMDSGTIRIHAATVGDNLVLTIEDNGCGFCEELNIDEVETLGLKIVRTLTRQLGGQLEISCEQGAQFQLTFEH